MLGKKSPSCTYSVLMHIFFTVYNSGIKMVLTMYGTFKVEVFLENYSKSVVHTIEIKYNMYIIAVLSFPFKLPNYFILITIKSSNPENLNYI